MNTKVNNIYALIVAGGTGTRFAADKPKQYLNLCGKSVIRHSIDRFSALLPLENIKIVIHPKHRDFYNCCTSGLNLSEPSLCGATRQESVYNGLKSFKDMPDDAIIFIHDAARPLLHVEDLQVLLDNTHTHRAMCLAAPEHNTQCYSDEDDKITQNIPRSHLWSLQTPQVFRYTDILKAHDTLGQLKNYTDDTSLIQDTGIKIHLIASKYPNFKITGPEDLKMAQHYLSNELSTEIRTGQGFDVHAFDLDIRSKNIRLCGVEVPHIYPLKGHSDADVALHALTDALLGAIGEGDIGLHFPPSNMDFKNMDSAVFLKHAVKLMNDKSGILVNVDITLICEKPKLGEYRNKMRMRVAEILGIAPSRVNIKATTTEKLGFTGREEGIAAQAVACVKMPQDDNAYD